MEQREKQRTICRGSGNVASIQARIGHPSELADARLMFLRGYTERNPLFTRLFGVVSDT